MSAAEYWSLIQSRVCRRCLDGDGAGGCRLPAGEMCALKELLPEIIRCVTSVQSETMDAYVGALRTNICASCEHQTADRSCAMRNHLECALDRYYPLVVQIIETVKENPAWAPAI